MKKQFLFFALLFASSQIFAQLDVKVNLLGLANKKIELGTEIGKGKLGVDINYAYTFKSWAEGVSVNDQDISVPRNGFIVGIKPNYYFKPKSSLDGFYVAPYLNYQNQTIKFDDPSKHNRMSTGLIFGRKGFFTDYLGYQVEFGAGYNFIYKYKDKATGEPENMEESIPFFGSLTKINLPFRISFIYRLGDYE